MNVLLALSNDPDTILSLEVKLIIKLSQRIDVTSWASRRVENFGFRQNRIG